MNAALNRHVMALQARITTERTIIMQVRDKLDDFKVWLVPGQPDGGVVRQWTIRARSIRALLVSPLGDCHGWDVTVMNLTRRGGMSSHENL
jgi:hypothetical protein